jgi:hypothetical protein
METSHPEIVEKINKDLEIKTETEASLKTAITEYKQGSPV